MKSLYLILSNTRYFALAWVFASMNIMIGSWVLYIPHIKEKLQIDEGQLGTALFILAAGIISMMPFVPWLSSRLGAGKSVLAAISLFCISYILPLCTETYVGLCVAVYGVGIASSFIDISINSLVSLVEKRDQVRIMSAAHGFFSIGGVIGAGIGNIFIESVQRPAMYMAIVALIVILVNIYLSRHYRNTKEPEVDTEPIASSPSKWAIFKLDKFFPLIGFGLIAFLIMGSEGAIEHWSKLYLLDVVGLSSEVKAGMGYIIFSAMMTLGRFMGDRMSELLGAYKLILLSCVISALGFIAILSMHWTFSMIGFALVGLGFAVVVPEVFRIAGQMSHQATAKNIAFVAGWGYAGFLISPALLGYIADMTTLWGSFLALLIGTLLTSTIVLYYLFKSK